MSETEQKIPNENAVVAKSNEILPALARFRLQELRLLAYCLAHYDSRKADSRTITANARDFEKLFPIDEKSAFRVIGQAVRGINSQPLVFGDFRKEKEIYWFSSLTHYRGEGRFEFKLNDVILPYILGLKKFFTRYRLQDVCAFRSAHTWRLYENLKQWEAIGSWFVELDELKSRLGVAGKYKNWMNLKKRVVNPAIKEINAKSDLYVTWETEKRGRRIHALLFFIHARRQPDAIDIGGSKEDFTRALMQCGIRKKTALDYAGKLEAQNELAEAAALLPELEKSWEKTGKGTLACYVAGTLRNRYFQGRLFPETEKSKPAQIGGVLNKTLDGLSPEF